MFCFLEILFWKFLPTQRSFLICWLFFCMFFLLLCFVWWFVYSWFCLWLLLVLLFLCLFCYFVCLLLEVWNLQKTVILRKFLSRTCWCNIVFLMRNLILFLLHICYSRGYSWKFSLLRISLKRFYDERACWSISNHFFRELKKDWIHSVFLQLTLFLL